MNNKLLSKRCCVIAVASAFSSVAYCASITIDEAVIQRFGITQNSLKSSVGNWVEGRYLPYTNNGNSFSISINGVSSVVIQKPDINCNYVVSLKHLAGVPYAFLSSGEENCGGIGASPVVYSEAAKKLAGQKHIRIGGYAYTSKDTVVLSNASNAREVATIYPDGTRYLYLGNKNPQTDVLAQFEIEIVDTLSNKIRLKLRHNIGNLSDKYLTRTDNKLSVTSALDFAPERGIFRLEYFSDEQAASRNINAGVALIADNEKYLVQSDRNRSLSLYYPEYRTFGRATFKLSTLEHLSGIGNVPNVHGKDPDSLLLAQEAEILDFESFHAPLKEKDYPENLIFRINEVPDISDTKNYFSPLSSVFLEADYDAVYDIFSSIKHQSKVIGADYVYPMKAVVTVADQDGNQYQIYDQYHMSSGDWTQLKSDATAAAASREPGSVADLSAMVLPTYIEKDQLTFVADTNCNSSDKVAYIKASNSCTRYENNYSDLKSNTETPRFIAIKLASKISVNKEETFSHQKMISAASGVYKEALNYVLSEQFLQKKTDLDALGYLGYLATVGLTSEDKAKLRTYLTNTLSTNALSVMRPAARSFPDVHQVYKRHYATGTDWAKEINSRHEILSEGIQTPYLDTFAFTKFSDMPNHAKYTASPYSLLPQYDAPLIIFGTMVGALQTIEKMQGADAAHAFYAKNGQNYHKLYKASALVLNQYGKKWIPATDRPLRRESIIYHAAYEYAQLAYDEPSEVLQSFCGLSNEQSKQTLTEAKLADCGLVELHLEEQEIAAIKQHEIARFMRVEKTHVDGGWAEILFPLITGPLVDYLFTGSLFGEEFEALLEDLATTDASEIELETVGSEEVAEGEAGEVAGEAGATTELGEGLTNTRFSSYCSI
ncbi:hypothetical protein PSECIP111854_01069 [Pseudoalteromonas sp. CIP111854]|uniref:Uncharacterized protein n=1 Tax=Pseudoalteromonas holothuriae TaxID=2963714 RepID=A0A9W4QTW9_9GAMM|nr:hypothetical protein [Pseudoalteromonas sp. CIP111854]CAH9052925.1 hypothetical protein PSECIP111854_01069 [Pseudoalteromonas sp. CIP111854]